MSIVLDHQRREAAQLAGSPGEMPQCAFWQESIDSLEQLEEVSDFSLIAGNAQIKIVLVHVLSETVLVLVLDREPN